MRELVTALIAVAKRPRPHVSGLLCSIGRGWYKRITCSR